MLIGTREDLVVVGAVDVDVGGVVLICAREDLVVVGAEDVDVVGVVVGANVDVVGSSALSCSFLFDCVLAVVVVAATATVTSAGWKEGQRSRSLQ